MTLSDGDKLNPAGTVVDVPTGRSDSMLQMRTTATPIGTVVPAAMPTPDEQRPYACGSTAGVSWKPNFAACVRSLDSALMFAC